MTFSNLTATPTTVRPTTTTTTITTTTTATTSTTTTTAAATTTVTTGICKYEIISTGHLLQRGDPFHSHKKCP